MFPPSSSTTAYAHSSDNHGNGYRRPSNIGRQLSGSTYQDLTQTYPIPYTVHRPHGPPKSPGNPTALALFVFAITLGTVGVYYARPAGLEIFNTVVGLTLFGGGFTLWTCAMLELWLGNTYGSVVLGGFSVFYLAFSATEIPWFGIVAAYDPSIAESGARQFSVSNGIWIAAYSIFDMIIWVPTWRISYVFNFIIGILIPCFWSLAIANFVTDPVQALHWQKAGGWFAIASAVVGFYAGAATIWTKETVGFDLPVGQYVRPLVRDDSEKDGGSSSGNPKDTSSGPGSDV